MKTIIILSIATFATFTTFAQKSKETSPASSKLGIYVAAKYTCAMHPEVVSSEPGKCPKCNMDLTPLTKEQMKAEVTHIYICPMHSDVVSNNPGICPKCSSKLVVDRRGSKQGITVYSCSMHLDVVTEKPGKCPICNLELSEVKAKNKSKKG